MSVLGSMLLSDKATALVMQLLTPEDFYSPAHAEIYRAMLRLVAAGRSIDYLTLKTDLLDHDVLASVGSEDYILQIAEAVPTASNAKHYAATVSNKAELRRIKRFFEEGLEMIHRPISIDKLRRQVVSSGVGAIKKVASVRTLASYRFELAAQPRGTTSRFMEINDSTVCHGYPAGQMVMVLGNTGEGKSTWLWTEAMFCADKFYLNRHPFYATFADLSGSDLYRRGLASYSGHQLENANDLYNPISDASIAADEFEERYGNLRIEEAYKNFEYLEDFLDWLELEMISGLVVTDLYIDYAQELKSRTLKHPTMVEQGNACASSISQFAAKHSLCCMVATQKDSTGDHGQWSSAWVNKCGLSIKIAREKHKDGHEFTTVKIGKNRFGERDIRLERVSFNADRNRFEEQ